jgi:hypothetical protein
VSNSDHTQEHSIKTPGDLQTTYVSSDISRNLIQRVSKYYAISSSCVVRAVKTGHVFFLSRFVSQFLFPDSSSILHALAIFLVR